MDARAPFIGGGLSEDGATILSRLRHKDAKTSCCEAMCQKMVLDGSAVTTRAVEAGNVTVVGDLRAHHPDGEC